VATRSIAVANQKGGVGKTTSTVSIAACAAETGRRVLVVDLDPQASASRWLGVDAEQGSVLDVLAGDATAREVLRPSTVERVDVIPASISLVSVERALGGQPGAEMVLSRALADITGDYDLVLLDCPPTLGLLAVSALVAAGEVLVPVGIGSMELDGVADLLRSVQLVADRLSPGLAVTAVLPCQYVPRQNLSRDVLEALTKRFGPDVVLPSVRSSVRMAEAPSAREPITTYAPRSPVAEDYRAATTALLKRGAR